jgi:hypothetical protein
MAESKHYGRQIVGSLVLTIIILGAVATLFGMYLIPKYQISREQIYNVAVKVFPLVIGLVMIQIGTMVASRRDEDYADEVDKLPQTPMTKHCTENRKMTSREPEKPIQPSRCLSFPLLSPHHLCRRRLFPLGTGFPILHRHSRGSARDRNDRRYV